MIFSGARIPHDQDSDFEDSETGSQEDSSATSFPVYGTEVASLIGEISAVVSHLYNLSITIRKSETSRDLLRKAGAIDLTHYEAWDIAHAKHKFPNADIALLKRLGSANTRRRQIFRYLESHNAKLSQTETMKIAGEQYKSANDASSDWEDPKLGSLANLNDTNNTVPHTELGTKNTQTTVQTFIETSSELLVDDTRSEVTSAVSDASEPEDNLRIPDLPSSAHDQKAFECPYCFDVLKVSGTKTWR